MRVRVCMRGSEEAERAGNIYVLYSEGGGVKSPDP